jgi:hemolysin III
MLKLDTMSRQELANTLTHGVGVLAALAGGAFLVTMASLRGDPWRIVGAAVFTATLVLLYTASTLYHAARARPWAKRRLKVLDHASIYLLIAGTYTPFTLGGLRGGWGWSLFGVIWGLAVAGVVFKLFAAGRFPRVSTAIYIAMGWLILIAVGPMARSLSACSHGVAPGGRAGLHPGHPLLPQPAFYLRPRRLARVRPGRQRVPRRGRGIAYLGTPGRKSPNYS